MNMKIDPAEEYYREAVNIAKAISVIYDSQRHCLRLSEKLDDNGDPAFHLSESLEDLAAALSHALIYADEYKNEAIQKQKRA